MKERVLRLLPRAANEDGEFAIAARMWDAEILFVSGSEAVRLTMRDGKIIEVTEASPDASAPMRIVGPEEGWGKLLAPVPQPFYQDLFGATLHHGFRMEGAVEDIYPYYPALRRLIEILRGDGAH